MTEKDIRKMTFSEKGNTIRGTKTQEELTEVYDQWARESGYDKDAVDHSFAAPGILATVVAGYVKDRELQILDVGAGTGLVAEKLRDFGFRNIDGLDPSQGMLRIAKDKDLYNKYITAYFTNNVVELTSSSYDVLVSCGAFAHGHLKCDVLPEMIRCVKTGGLIFLLMREHDVLVHPEYKDQLEPYMSRLEQEGRWTFVERRVFAGYFPGVKGLLYVYRVTK